MQKNSKIYLAGHLGLVGSALHRNLISKGYKNFVLRSIDELNLMDQLAVTKFFESEKPDYVILAAAKVGGIIANNTYRAQFIYENIQIQNNIIHQSYLNGVKKLLFLGSSCIYPKNCPQPMKEEYLLTGILEITNEPYALAKIAGLKMCEAYNQQYGTNFISVMPTNLFGPNDNYDLEKSHVLPAMIRKLHLAKCLENNDWISIRKDLKMNPVQGINDKASETDILQVLEKYGISLMNKNSVSVSLWGTGSPKREFLHSDDMADACVYLMENIDAKDILNMNASQSHYSSIPSHINIGTGRDLTIKELANMVRDVTGFKGEIMWDSQKPDGTFQKLLDVSTLNNLGWKEKTGLMEGIKSVYQQRIVLQNS
jgi:GDP-L-fucose synthase